MDAVLEREDLTQRLEAASLSGMTMAVWADVQPDKAAVVDPDGRARSFAEVNANANRIVRLLRQAGLKAGDAVAVVTSNRHEFLEVQSATLRAVFRITPVNWHLTVDEIAYILNDCEAQAVFGEARITTVAPAAAEAWGLTLKVAVAGDIDGFVNYDEALAGIDPSDIDDPVL